MLKSLDEIIMPYRLWELQLAISEGGESGVRKKIKKIQGASLTEYTTEFIWPTAAIIIVADQIKHLVIVMCGTDFFDMEHVKEHAKYPAGNNDLKKRIETKVYGWIDKLSPTDLIMSGHSIAGHYASMCLKLNFKIWHITWNGHKVTSGPTQIHLATVSDQLTTWHICGNSHMSHVYIRSCHGENFEGAHKIKDFKQAVKNRTWKELAPQVNHYVHQPPLKLPSKKMSNQDIHSGADAAFACEDKFDDDFWGRVPSNAKTIGREEFLNYSQKRAKL